jgi:dTDP-4-dehydrorhamnose reductase
MPVSLKGMLEVHHASIFALPRRRQGAIPPDAPPMRLLIAGWHGQAARTFMDMAPSRADIAVCAAGRPSLDLGEPRSIERAFGDVNPDVVINAAAYTSVDEAASQPERAFALNRDGARQLAHAAARRGIPLIHLSTAYVFDGLKAEPYTEDDAPNPQTVYGQSKLAGELAVQEANPKHIILRTAWMYSPFGRNFVKTILERRRGSEPLRVVSDQHGSPTYVPHLAEAALTIARRLTAGEDGLWGVYHAAGGGSATWHDMAAEILRQPGVQGGAGGTLEAIGSDAFPARAPRPANARLDCTRLERVFGLRLPPWQEGVAECVRRLLQ